MEWPSKIIEQIAYNIEPKIEEHVLIVLDKSIHEEHLVHPLQSNINQFKIAITFLTACNGISNVTNWNNDLYFTVWINDDDFDVMSIPPGAYEKEGLKDEIKLFFFQEGFFKKN